LSKDSRTTSHVHTTRRLTSAGGERRPQPRTSASCIFVAVAYGKALLARVFLRGSAHSRPPPRCVCRRRTTRRVPAHASSIEPAHRSKLQNPHPGAPHHGLSYGSPHSPRQPGRAPPRPRSSPNIVDGRP
jgi:hypothetical protein